MATRTSRFMFDWWVVSKRSIYLGIALIIALILASGAALYVWKFGNPLKNVGTELRSSAGARFISFEGDVRVIRAATRQTVTVNSDTELYPGDTVQTLSLIHISEPTRLLSISYAVFCL